MSWPMPQAAQEPPRRTQEWRSDPDDRRHARWKQATAATKGTTVSPRFETVWLEGWPVPNRSQALHRTAATAMMISPAYRRFRLSGAVVLTPRLTERASGGLKQKGPTCPV